MAHEAVTRTKIVDLWCHHKRRNEQDRRIRRFIIVLPVALQHKMSIRHHSLGGRAFKPRQIPARSEQPHGVEYAHRASVELSFASVVDVFLKCVDSFESGIEIVFHY